MPLAEFETAILNVLDGHGGYTTGQIAERIDFQFGHNRRVHSAAVRTLLLGLEKQGVIKRMDDQKPDCWVKATQVELGTGGARDKVKLSLGEEAFMKSVLKEAGLASAGSTVSYDHTDGRAVSGLVKKGLVLRHSGEVELTKLGAEWLSQAAKNGSTTPRISDDVAGAAVRPRLHAAQ
ncbi:MULTISPECIES: Lrp/AsnC family transcriptional regulator [Ralstonia]|jgi:hypothetical protein|uniref:Uncharacterized protein n=2 Tax=Ralstonia pickettii TaxID=329 RepID=R0CNM5_RALPI|nr:Lrp/AsnC family transcriptional regulator [Ralstonia pickettii]ENZ78080.1 hypothetical protein OR214_02356 [Ralstonia pickettii OR214]MCM3581834.1 Lrp/AsnC family transcriptional regulator [Ralstonia pickettii]